MRKCFIIIFTLMCTLTFANTGNKSVSVEILDAFNSIDNSSYLVSDEAFFDCLLKLTFVFEDGTTETRYVLVKGSSCDEILNN